MDFKIGDDIEDMSNGKKKDKGITPIIIVVVGALIIGLVVFLISSLIFKGNEPVETPPVDQQLNIADATVQVLYKSISYGTRTFRDDKFIKNDSVNLNSFSDSEKYFYALQFVQQTDFEETGEVDSTTNKKVYRISNDSIKSYMQRFFGPQVNYSTEEKVTHTFRFDIDGNNYAELTYSEEFDGFKAIFTEKKDFIANKDLIKPYYTSLFNAVLKADKTLVIEEKVIYTHFENEEGKYKIKITSDPQNNQIIEEKQNITAEQLNEVPIDILDYGDKTGIVTYLFKVNGNSYYLDSSTLSSPNNS